MKILRPIKTNRLAQGWGESKACGKWVDGKIQVVSKVDGVCPAEFVDLYAGILGMNGHNGEDWAAWHGEPLYFPVEEGEWRIQTEVDSAGGIGINVISKEPVALDAYYGYIKFKFWHLLKPLVADGETVKFGQLIGFCDNTGLSGGDHLHWSMKKCDENGTPSERNNGYYGAESFEEWYQNEFVIDFLIKQNIEAQIEEAQLSFIQILNKLIFLLQEQIRRIGGGFGAFLEKIQKGR